MCIRDRILADRLPLSSATTIATRLGAWPERIAMLLAVVALLVAVAMRTRFTQRFTAVRPHKGAGTAPEKSEEYTGDEQ